MNKYTGIITEYNPFHNGHLYHLKQTKKITESQNVICIMNGNFVQRGKPALTDKWSRTKMALNNGVDLVIELPLVYGIRSAEYFAEGAIRLMDKINIVDKFVFGSESGELEPLKYIAEIFWQEPDLFKKHIKNYLKKGFSFPRARAMAFKEYLKTRSANPPVNITGISKIISEPNNILGIEYIKALKKYNISNLTPCCLKRSHKNYHSQGLTHKMASATAIRNIIYNQVEKTEKIKDLMPSHSWKILNSDLENNKIPIKMNYLGIIILNKLRQLKSSNLNEYIEIKGDLKNRILRSAHRTGNYKHLIEKIKTKHYTRTRVQRNLLHILFELKEKTIKQIDTHGPQYIRVLGFTKNGEKILSHMKKNSSLPIITQPASYLKSINRNSNDILKKQLSFDLLSTDIYSLLYKNHTKRMGNLDYTNPVITE